MVPQELESLESLRLKRGRLAGAVVGTDGDGTPNRKGRGDTAHPLHPPSSPEGASHWPNLRNRGAQDTR